MASLQRLGRCFLASTTSFVKQSRCCAVVAGSTQHTLSVRKRIEKTREAALMGGGKKRIDKQHQKVPALYLAFYFQQMRLNLTTVISLKKHLKLGFLLSGKHAYFDFVRLCGMVNSCHKVAVLYFDLIG